MYYGNSSATDQQQVSPTATEVWDSNYVGVWHLHDTSGNTQDSTSYNTDGVLSGTVTRGATGKLDNAFDFSTNGEVDWGDPADGHLDFGTGAMTLSLWVYMDSHRGVWEQIILKGKSSWQPGYQIEVNSSSNIFYFAISDGSISEWGRSASISFSLDTWTHVVGVVDRSSNLLRAYKNGVQVDTTGISGMGSINVSDELTLGRDSWGWPDAVMEDVRISNVARSANWIQTEYNNQNDNTSFFSVGPEENETGGGSCGTNLVMVTVDGTTTTDADDAIKAALFQSWGWTVTAIADSDPLATYQSAAASNDVMYIAESVQSTSVGTKARDLTIGVVVDEDRLWDEMGFESGGTYYEEPGTDITILDDSHYITSLSSTGSLSVYSQATDIGSVDGVANLASGITVLATRVANQPSLFTADTDAQLIGLTAPARRVGFYTATGNASYFTTNTETLLQRSLDWAAGCGAGDSSGCGTNLVMVTIDGTTTTDTDDASKKTLFESWGWTVTAIADDAAQGTYDSAAANNDVMYISESSESGMVGTKATLLDLGIVVEENHCWDEMRFTSGSQDRAHTTILIGDNSHYITSVFSTGNMMIYPSQDNIGSMNGPLAGEGQSLATENATGSSTLFAYDTGAALSTGTAPNRRVGVPTSESSFSSWNTDVKTIVQRSLEWAGGCGAGGGATNNDPVLTPIGNKGVEEGQLLEFTISATDPDTGDTLTYSASNLPTGASFDPGTQTFSWTPNAGDAGSYPNVQFTVTDDGTPQGSDSESITITVSPVGSGSGIPITADDIEDYSCSRKITIDHTQVEGSSSHSNFPVFISLTDDSLKTGACAFVTSSSGDDIIFTNSAKTLQLYHEIQKYDESTGELDAWVKIPTLSHDSDTVLYLYYGNSDVASPQENPDEVWANGFAAVWHLEDEDNIEDSTAYSNDWTGTPSNVNNATGKIGIAQDFDGNDSIQVPNSASLDITNDEITLSAWVKMTSVQNDDAGIINKSYSNNYNYLLNVQNSEQANFRVKTSSGTTYLTGSTTLAVGQWYFIYGIYNGSTAKVYVNNFEDGTANRTGSIESSAPAPVNLGRRRTYPTADDRFFDGVIDEARIANVARSVDWMKTEYNNQNNPSSFYSVDPPQCPDIVPAINEFTCDIPITIDSSKVGGISDLIHFPVLIDLTNTALKTTSNCGYVQNSNGWDIIFSDSTKTVRLDHEIEEYNASSGRLVAWVRIPTLSVESDTTIYVHFGHSGVCGATENPDGVWDSNYVGVWHLHDDYEDSTANNNDGNPVNMDAGNGQIATGGGFDGTDDYIEVADDSSLHMANEITVSAWINPDDVWNWRTIVSKMSGTNSELYFVLEDQTLILKLNGPMSSDWWSGVNVYQDQWAYVAFTYSDSTDTVTMYKNDGSSTDSISRSGTLNLSTNNDPLYIGANTGWPGEDFDGDIDEVRISNVARSVGWLQTSYNNQNDPSSFYSVGTSSCWLGGFSCNRKITIDSSKVAGTSNLTDFPMLVKIENDCNLKSEANGGSVKNINGWDIVFTDSDGFTQLDHEIEKYDGTDGDLIAWVRIPSLPDDTDKDIYMYYGHSNLTCDPSNPTGVWNSNYRAVYHLHDDYDDSTQNNRDGTNYGTTFTTGIIGNGALFTPSDGWDRIELGTWYLWGDDITIQAWAWPNDFNQNDPRVVSKCADWGSSTQQHVFMLSLTDGDNGENRMRFRVKTGTDDALGTVSYVGTSPNGYLPTAQNWYFLAATQEDDRSPTLRMFRDNGLNAGTTDHYGDLRQNSWPIYIGANPYGSSNTSYSWDGILDEVRIVSTDLSQSWFQTEYNNVSDPDSFYTMNQDTCGGEYSFNYQYCRKITVDHTQVNSDLTDFPLLVNITGEDDLKTVANGGHVEHSQGWDIVFKTDGCGTLDHEIEKYDGSTGDLVAWVRVPTLSSSTDTEIYMYYGTSPVICSPENPDGVWDSNYQAVYHLKEDPTSTDPAPQIYDSTENDHDGTSYGSMTSDGQVPGQIDGGIEFDGGNDYIDIGNFMSAGVSQVTMEAWVDKTDGDDTRVVSKSDGTNASGTQHKMTLRLSGSSPQISARLNTVNNVGVDLVSANSVPNDTLMHHVAWTYDGAAVEFYIDGTLSNCQLGGHGGTGNSCTPTGDIISSGRAIVIGNNDDIPNSRFFGGIIDEVRISDIARSADWLDAQYKNHTNANFYSITSCFEQTTQMTEAWEEDFE
jgi:hypothetical protein